MRSCKIAFALILLIIFEIGSAMATPIEITISQRISVREYRSQPVTSQQLLTLLRASYGYVGAKRVLPKIGDAYSLTIFSINSSGSYRYAPETNSISVWDRAVTKESISPHLTQSWENEANVVIVIAWNSIMMDNEYFAYLEAGCFVQNFYLAAVNSGIGTTCAQTFDSDGLSSDLKLQNTPLVPLLIMPTGFPKELYPNANPDYNRMTRNLPPVQNSPKSFEDALGNMNITQSWSAQTLSLQEQSQLLWAAYGYSSTGHRTTPSWGGLYPLSVYMSNATGTFRYSPESHSIQLVQAGDKRSSIAATCGNQMWVANAPAIFLVGYNSSYHTAANSPEPGWYDKSVEVDAGCVVQQILIESSAISLGASLVTKGFEPWNGNSARDLRNTLSLASSIVPLCIVAVGHPVSSGTPSPIITIISPKNKYSEEDVPLTFTVSESTSWIGFSLDGKANVTITGNTTLTGLSDGTHSILVYAKDLFGNIGASSKEYFTIGHPSVSILSPENKTYDVTDISLILTVSETAPWIAYSLDGEANMTITENATLSELSYGPHNLIVYAKDSDGNIGTSETVYFTVANKPEPFSTTLIAAGITVIALCVAISVGALTYRRKKLKLN